MRHFHPVVLAPTMQHRAATKQVMPHKRVPLFKLQGVIITDSFYGLNLTICCRNNKSTANTTNSLYQQFKHNHRLPNSQFIQRQVHLSVIIRPQLETAPKQSVRKVTSTA